MTDFFAIVQALQRHNVRFIIVGGLAGVLRGVPMQTFDLDIVHQRTDENIEALLGALGDLHAYARHHPQRPAPNVTHLQGDGHLLLETDHGSLDVLGSIDGGATYDDLVEHASPMDLDGGELLGSTAGDGGLPATSSATRRLTSSTGLSSRARR